MYYSTLKIRRTLHWKRCAVASPANAGVYRQLSNAYINGGHWLAAGGLGRPQGRLRGTSCLRLRGVADGKPRKKCRLKSRRGVAVGQPRRWCRLKSRRGVAVGKPMMWCQLKSRREVAVGQHRKWYRHKCRRGVAVGQPLE
jgi:hypothetical protein